MNQARNRWCNSMLLYLEGLSWSLPTCKEFLVFSDCLVKYMIKQQHIGFHSGYSQIRICVVERKRTTWEDNDWRYQWQISKRFPNTTLKRFTCKSNNASTDPGVSAELVHSVRDPNSKTCPNVDSEAPWVRQIGNPCKIENFGYDVAYTRTPTVRTPTTFKPMSNVRLLWRESVHPRFVK